MRDRGDGILANGVAPLESKAMAPKKICDTHNKFPLARLFLNANLFMVFA